MPGSDHGFRRWVVTNQGVGTLLTVILGAFLIHLLLTEWVHRDLRDGFKLGFFPVAGVIAMMLCTIALMFDSRRRQITDDLRDIEWKNWLYCFAALIGCYVYFALSELIGFLLVTPVFLFVLMYFLGVRPWTTALASGAIVTVIVYGLFRMLGIAMTQGILPF